MNEISPVYMSDLAAQLGSVSAFLGGFAATFLGTLLALRAKGRIGTVTIGFAAASSVAFIVTVVAAAGLFNVLHPEAPGGGASDSSWLRTVMALNFLLGLITLLISLGLSGWLRSRATGWTTSVIAGLGIILTLTTVS